MSKSKTNKGFSFASPYTATRSTIKEITRKYFDDEKLLLQGIMNQLRSNGLDKKVTLWLEPRECSYGYFIVIRHKEISFSFYKATLGFTYDIPLHGRNISPEKVCLYIPTYEKLMPEVQRSYTWDVDNSCFPPKTCKRVVNAINEYFSIGIEKRNLQETFKKQAEEHYSSVCALLKKHGYYFDTYNQDSGLHKSLTIYQKRSQDKVLIRCSIDATSIRTCGNDAGFMVNATLTTLIEILEKLQDVVDLMERKN